MSVLYDGPMSDYIEWYPTDEVFDELIIWWGTREPVIHEDNCTDERQLHCCFGMQKHHDKRYALYCSAPSWDLSNMTFVHPDGTEVPMDAGDRLYYDGEGVYRLEKK